MGKPRGAACWNTKHQNATCRTCVTRDTTLHRERWYRDNMTTVKKHNGNHWSEMEARLERKKTLVACQETLWHSIIADLCNSHSAQRKTHCCRDSIVWCPPPLPPTALIVGLLLVTEKSRLPKEQCRICNTVPISRGAPALSDRPGFREGFWERKPSTEAESSFPSAAVWSAILNGKGSRSWGPLSKRWKCKHSVTK